ncbi:DNA recombination protein RmuC, partial [Patescibacteria group bacterium]|nr:DNA recombination protein RmuC [Patescibacteria group bacterium]
MEPLFLILIVTGVFLVGMFIFSVFLLRKEILNLKDKDKDSTQSLMLQNQIAELNRTLDLKLGESSKAIRDQFGESTKIIKEITQELVKVGEGQKQVMNVTDQLKSLQDILKNPKQRGVLGEYYLETVLKNVLPPD